MQIVEATIHQLSKAPQTKGPGSVIRQVRTAALPIDDTLKGVCVDLLAMYGTRANSTGTFGQVPTLHQFPVRLGDYVSKKISFHDFTVDTLALIQNEMEKSHLASGGFALFLRYQQGGGDYLLVAMLKLKPGAGINQQTLDLEPTLNIDVGLLHEAARISLSRLAAGTEPYLSFIRGKAKAGEVTEYFRAALACQNFTSAKHHTEQLIQAATDFVNERTDLTTEEQRREEHIRMRASLYECFASSKDEVVLLTLAAAVMPSDPQNFVDFVKDAAALDKYNISDSFQPHKDTFNRLKRIRGAIGKTIKVSFAVEDVQTGRVVYDQQTDSIVLAGPPGELKKAIQENALTP